MDQGNYFLNRGCQKLIQVKGVGGERGICSILISWVEGRIKSAYLQKCLDSFREGSRNSRYSRGFLRKRVKNSTFVFSKVCLIGEGSKGDNSEKKVVEGLLIRG